MDHNLSEAKSFRTFTLFGAPNSGKSTLLNTIKSMLSGSELGNATTFYTSHLDATAFDAPSDVTRTAEAAALLSQADVGVLVLDANNVDGSGGGQLSEENKRLIKLAVFMGVTEFICVVNKMDLVDQGLEEVFNANVAAAAKVFKGNGIYPRKIPFVPVSAHHGSRVVEQHGFWFKSWMRVTEVHGNLQGQTVLEALDCYSHLDSDDTDKPLRMHVLESSENPDGGIKVMARAAAGTLLPGSQVVIPPYHYGTVEVSSIHRGLEKDGAPSQCLVELHIDEQDVDVRTGSVIAAADDDDPPRAVESFNAQFRVTSREANFCDGNTYNVCVHMANVPCQIEVLKASQRGGGAIDSPGSLSFGQVGIVSFTPLEPLVVEERNKYNSLGRFVALEGDDLVGAGMVTACHYDD